MTSHKLSIKFPANDVAKTLSHDAFVPVFHGWIQRKALPEHLLIDVADYAHVPDGPGSLVVSHEANIHLDHTDHQTGLLYVRKQPGGETFEQNLKTVLRGALRAAALLEGDDSLKGVKFDTSRATFRIHDRLNAPNAPETFAAVKGALEKVLGEAYGSPVKLTYKPDRERLFRVDVESTNATDVNTLLSRL